MSPPASDPSRRWPRRLAVALAAVVFALPLLYLLTDRAVHPRLWRWSARQLAAIAVYGACYAALLASWRVALPSWLRTARGLLLMTGATLVVNFVVIETVLEALDDAPYTPLPDIGRHAPDPDLGHVFRPDFEQVLQTREWRTVWHSNSQGLRADREYGPRPQGVIRLLAVGDSYTAGEQVPLAQTWPGVLERELRARGEDGLEVVNAGVPAYGTVHEARWIAKFAPALRPDGIVLAMTPNDLGENLSPDWVRARWGAMVNRKTKEGHFRRWEDRHRWYSVPGWWWRSLLVQRIQRALRGQGEGSRVYTHRHAYMVEPDAEADRRFAVTEGYLREARDAAARLGADFAIIVIPFLDQLRPMPEGLDPGVFGRRILGFAEAEGIPALDLLPAFRADPDPDALYWREDTHCTAKGYVLVGKATAAFLSARGWPSPPAPSGP